MLEIIANPNIDDFIELPFVLYKGNSFFIPELKSDTKHLLTKDPFWQNAKCRLFLAVRDKKPVGRIAAILNKNHNDYWKDDIGFFGFFECEDNQETASALIQAAKGWLKEQGCPRVRGPLNPSTNHTCGVLLDNFDKDPVVMMPYNPPFYNAMLEGAGLKKAKDLVAFERTDKNDFSPRVQRIIERILKNPEIKIRQINLKDFDREVQTVRRIYNASWAQNWGFVPITEDEIKQTAKQLKMIVKKELTSIIEINGEPAGFAISIPNMNRVLKVLHGSLGPIKILRALFAWANIHDCRTIMLGVLPEHRKRGLDLLLVKEIVENGVKKGWNKAELSWLLEDNQGIISLVEEAGCHKTKTYRIYESEIN